MNENTDTDSTREPRHVQIARAFNRDPRPILPPDTPVDLADRLSMLVIAGASALQLPAACGNVEYRDGYTRRKLASFDFRELENLIDAARARLEQLEGEIAARCAQQRRLVALLSPAAADDKSTAPSAPLDDDDPTETRTTKTKEKRR